MPYWFVRRAPAVGLTLAVLTASAPCREAPTDVPPVAYAPEPAVEGRALWVNRFEYASPGDIAAIMAKAAAANFNIIYFQVRGQADAYYHSDLEPCAIRLCGRLGDGYPPYDPLEIAVREAHARGLELHAWLNAFAAWASPTANTAQFCSMLVESRPGFPRHMLLAHPDWVMALRDGTPMDCYTSQEPEYAYVSPGIPGVRAQLAAVAADIARRYAVDGIHLDRVRYPGPQWSWDEPSVAAFRVRFGREPSSASEPDWQRFRQEQIDTAVKNVFDAITAIRPNVVLSAAVWPI